MMSYLPTQFGLLNIDVLNTLHITDKHTFVDYSCNYVSIPNTVYHHMRTAIYNLFDIPIILPRVSLINIYREVNKMKRYKINRAQ